MKCDRFLRDDLDARGTDMKRRDFIKVLSGILIWPLAASAQQGKIWRIGLLEMSALALNTANMEAFLEGLRALGYVEGRNLMIDYRSADGVAERFHDLATELVKENCDLILTRGTPAVLAAKNTTAAIPIVIAASGAGGSGIRVCSGDRTARRCPYRRKRRADSCEPSIDHRSGEQAQAPGHVRNA
jgi:ABC-type uncharacterized transport system substrate-binding protein